jgi:hypothetical protein
LCEGGIGLKRYFDVIGQNVVMELEVKEGSLAAVATAEEIGKAFKSQLRETDKAEYLQLKKRYEQ